MTIMLAVPAIFFAATTFIYRRWLHEAWQREDEYFDDIVRLTRPPEDRS